jgi:hypothetical protein
LSSSAPVGQMAKHQCSGSPAAAGSALRVAAFAGCYVSRLLFVRCVVCINQLIYITLCEGPAAVPVLPVHYAGCTWHDFLQ